MASYPKNQCLRWTIGFVCDTNRYQIVLPYGTEDPIDPAVDTFGDFSSFLTTVWIPAWQSFAAEDCEVVGHQLEGLIQGTPIIPNRENFASGTYIGSITGDSTPAQTSALLEWHSFEQAGTGNRLAVAKSYIGPMPEASCDSGVINAGAPRTALGGIADTMRSFVGSETGVTWKRLVGPTKPVADAMYIADQSLARDVLFTQRRRMLPLF